MNLTPFKTIIKQRCGLTIEGIAEKQLQLALDARIAGCNVKNHETYLKQLMFDDHEFYELVCLLTINETYFYREQEQLSFLVNNLAPRFLSYKQDNTPIRILSAGCSAGEEVYSIAIALREKYGASAERLFWLAGGDIDKKVLAKARIGCYTEFSFRSLPSELREQYFDRLDKTSWKVKPEIHQSAEFFHLNLLDTQHKEELQNFDIIFFRNVSIYFDQATRITIQQNIASLLKETGALIVGSAETLANDLGILTLHEENGMFYFMKQPKNIAQHQFNVLPEAEPVFSDNWFTIDEATTPVPSLPVEILPPIDPVDQALNLVKAKSYPAALQAIEALLNQQPEHNNVLLLKAYIVLNQKQFVEVEKIALHVLEMDRWSIDAMVLLGLAMKWRNQSVDAVKWFKQAVYACHDCWIAHYYLAELYRADQAFEKARRAYRVVLQILSTSTEVKNGLALIPIELPMAEVCFLCQNQLAKLDNMLSHSVQ